MLKNYLLVFFISMVPIVELRGAIPIGLGLGLPALPTYFLCVLGNMLPVPFIYLFARKFLIWGYHKPLIGPVCRFCINKGEKGGRALEAKAGRGLTLTLLLFVGIPLPGTGAWTGTLARGHPGYGVQGCGNSGLHGPTVLLCRDHHGSGQCGPVGCVERVCLPWADGPNLPPLCRGNCP